MFGRQGDEAGSPEPDRDVSWEAVEGEFIVRFREYRMAAEHRAALEAGLRPDAAGWQWVERHNQAAQHPTDFGLLRISLADVEAVKVRDPVGWEDREDRTGCTASTARGTRAPRGTRGAPLVGAVL